MAAAELHIDDVIGEGWWYTGITSRYVNRWLRENKGASEIIVRLNTPGGDVFEGQAICSALKRCDAHVIMEVEGLAASAGSVILMAGDERRVNKGAFVMIHEAWGGTMGTAADHEKTAGLLRKVNSEIADIYAARSGQTPEKCLEMMAVNETWLTAEEALALGFCDSVIPAKASAAKPKTKAGARAMAQAFNAFRNAPVAARALFDFATDADDDENGQPPAAPQAHRTEHRLVRAAAHISDFHHPRALGRGGLR